MAIRDRMTRPSAALAPSTTSEGRMSDEVRAGGRRPSAGLRALSLRETRVICLVGDGRSDHEIAQLMAMGVEEVGTALAGIFWKLGIRSRTELALLTPGEGLPPARSAAGRRPPVNR